jgi:hypothetical protein
MAFSFGTPTSDLQRHLKKIDPNVKSVQSSGKDYKVTYNDGVTRTLSSAGVKDLESKFAIPTGRYGGGDDNAPEYFYDYRSVTPQDIARADVNYVAPQAGFNPATYDPGDVFGIGDFTKAVNAGATRQNILDIAKRAPVVGDRMQQLFPELRGIDSRRVGLPAGLSPEQLSGYDVSTGIGLAELENLLNLGATPEQVAELTNRATVVDPGLRTLFPKPVVPFAPSVPEFNYAPPAGLAAIAPPTPVSLVQAAEAPVLAPSVQTVAGMKGGGLASVAQELASKGRGGDTMLAHINPEEAGILKALGGSGTINPKTGLPEFISLFPKKGISLNFGPLGKVKFGKKSSDLIQAATAIYLGSYMPGGPQLSTAGSAAVYGGVRAADTGSLTEGIRAGLTAYSLASAYQGLGGSAPPAAGGSGAAGGGGGGAGSMSGGPAGVESGVVEAGTVPVVVESVPATVPPATGADMGFNVAAPGAGFSYPEGSFAYDAGGEFIPVGSDYVPSELVQQQATDIATKGDYLNQQKALPYLESMKPVSQQTPTTPTAPDGYLAKTLPASAQEYVPDFLLDASGTTLAAGTLLGTSLLGGAQERQTYARQQAALRAEEEEKKRRYRELFASTLGQVPIRTARQGGLMSLAKGGMTYMEAGGTTGLTGMPRDVTGTGDGMSDSVPATIEGVQEARLADGEFVIPADVVADIGNGSSGAGSKKLYSMMDRIRKARHGTTKQPPEINAEALMPA